MRWLGESVSTGSPSSPDPIIELIDLPMPEKLIVSILLLSQFRGSLEFSFISDA